MNSVLDIAWRVAMNTTIAFLNTYCWCSCTDTSISKNKKKTIISIIIMDIFTAFLNYNTEKFIRLFVLFIFLTIVCYFYICKNINKATLMVIVSEIILWITEFTLVIVTSIFMSNRVDAFLESSLGFFLSNIYIFIIAFLFIKTGIPRKVYKKTCKTLEMINVNETSLYLTLVILMIILSTIETHLKLSFPIILTINTTIAIIVIIIIIRLTIVKGRYNKINSKYQTSISCLREHETMIDKFRVNTHENKNELMTIRNMSKEKKIIEYIDKLVDNKIKDNEKIMNKTFKIPEGGLRATIYTKLCVMDKYKIKYQLDIASDVKTVDLIGIDENIMISICKILGVFLDNAIEAVMNLKDKKVSIELYLLDDSLYIDITNDYTGEINLKNMTTTKGEGHGYGLLLVNEIINKSNGILENEKRIEKNLFIQSLIIKKVTNNTSESK